MASVWLPWHHGTVELYGLFTISMSSNYDKFMVSMFIFQKKIIKNNFQLLILKNLHFIVSFTISFLMEIFAQ